jgi:hypothetical protein
MPLSRLVVVALPGCLLAAAYIFGTAARWASGVRWLLAVAGLLFVAVRVAPRAARVGETRLALIDKARAALAGRCVVAGVDAGWIGAATRAPVVDLAGVSDPAVAALRGGHTSKQIPRDMLRVRGVDTVVLLLASGAVMATPWSRSSFSRYTEAYLAPRLEARGYQVTSLRAGPLHYLVATTQIACALQVAPELR